MSSSREAIASALFALLSTTTGAATASRRLKHWSEVNSVEMPALFLTQGTETFDETFTKVGSMPRKTMNFTAYLYAHSGGLGTSVPSTILNGMIDAIENALRPNLATGQKQTLGNLVVHCYIAGTVQTDEGVLGDTGVAVVPIEVLTT